MDVTLKQLRSFIVVADELSFTRAAARLYVSQPALSVQIASLERALAVTLFRRTSRTVELTDAGRSLHEDLAHVFAELDRARERAQRIHGRDQATLRIAYTASAAYQALPLILDHLASEQSDVRVVSKQEWSTQAIESVRLGTTDVALVREFSGLDGLASHVVRLEPLAAFMSSRHALASCRQLAVADLRNHIQVVVPGRLAPGFHSLLGRLCAARGFDPVEVELESPDNREPLLAHLSRHPEHMFVGPVSMSNVTWDGVVQVPIGDDDARMRLTLVWRQDAVSPMVDLARAAASATAAREGWLEDPPSAVDDGSGGAARDHQVV